MRLFSITIKSSWVKNMKTIEIDTKCGRIKGIEKENTTEWLGIKYATAKRWEYPQTVKNAKDCPVFIYIHGGSFTGGNFGLYDQVSAIECIRDNIASFGGDKNKITVAGQSAGARKIIR